MGRKFTAVLACILAAGALVSCGKSGGSSSSAGSTAAEKSTINPDISEKVKENLRKQMDEKKKQLPSLSKSSVPLPADARNVLEGFILSAYGSDKMKALSYLYPQSILNAVEGTSIADNFSVAGMDGAELKNLVVTDCARLAPDTGYKTVEEYFSKTASNNDIEGVSVSVTNGYCATFDFTIAFGDEEYSETPEATLVCLDGDGWKLIPMSISDLMETVKQ